MAPLPRDLRLSHPGRSARPAAVLVAAAFVVAVVEFAAFLLAAFVFAAPAFVAAVAFVFAPAAP